MYIFSPKSNCMLICGPLARDAEMKKTQTGKTKTRFSVKYDEIVDGDKKEAKWLDCEAWGPLARYAALLEKGDNVLVFGKLRQYKYTGKDGEAKEGTSLNCGFIFPQPTVEIPATDEESGEFNSGSAFSELQEGSDGDLPF